MDDLLKIERMMVIPDDRVTEVYFTRLNDEGFSDSQIEYICKLVEKYMKKFEFIQIEKVMDHCSRNNNFYYNKEGNKYSEWRTLGEYFIEEKEIVFNHIRVSKFQLKNNSFIQEIEIQNKKIKEIKKERKALLDKMEEIGMLRKQIEELSKQDPLLKELSQKHEICMDMENIYFNDVCFIRCIEENEFIERIVLHEIGHAICHQYAVKYNSEIKELYKICKDGFENIDEFLAECFMAGELTDQIQLANKVSDIIYKICKVENV